MKYATFAIIALCMFNCSRMKQGETAHDSLRTTSIDTLATPIQQEPDSSLILEAYLEKTDPDTAKLLRIDTDCAVIVFPNDEQLAQMKREYGEEDFYTIADDYSFYQGTAVTLLDSFKIKTVAAERPYVKFINKQNAWTLNLRRKGLPEWNLIFFNKDKLPVLVSSFDLTAEQIQDYFGK